MPKPKVLLIVNRLNIGGPAMHVLSLAKYLQPDFETLLVAGQVEEAEGNALYMAEDFGIKPILLPEMQRALHPLKDRQAYQKLKEIIQDFQPDIVHTHAAKPGAIGRLAAHHSNIKGIVHTFHGHVFHSYFGTLKTRFYIEVEKYLAKISSKIIAISNLQKQELTESFHIAPKQKMEVIQLGYRLERFYEDFAEKRKKFREQWKIQEGEIAIGIVGRLTAIKNHKLFIESVAPLLANKKIKAFIIGDGEERKNIEEKTSELKITFDHKVNPASQIVFTSWIKEMEEVYAGLDIVCLTSLNEGTPVTLIEALAANCAIVSTDVGGVRDVVEDMALLSPSENTTQFRENLNKTIMEYDFNQRFQNLGKQAVLKAFSLENMLNRHKELYYELIK